MLGRTLLWASEKEWVQRLVTEGKLTRGVVKRFVAGDRLDDAVEAIRELNSKKVGGILDRLGEGVTDPVGVQAEADAYLESIKRISTAGIDTTVTVKLTQLGLAIDKGACIDHLRLLAAEAQAIGAVVEIDMEQSEYVTDTIEVFRLLRADFPDLRLAMQAYLRRTLADLESLADMPPKVRLVKGAYAEPPELAFQKKTEIDEQYRFLTDWLFEKGHDPAIASHDGRLIEHAIGVAERTGKTTKDYEIQMLYGIRRELQEQLAAQGHRVRVYVPFGSDWYPYLMRRMAERPRNVRFFMRAVVRD